MIPQKYNRNQFFRRTFTAVRMILITKQLVASYIAMLQLKTLAIYSQRSREKVEMFVYLLQVFFLITLRNRIIGIDLDSFKTRKLFFYDIINWSL